MPGIFDISPINFVGVLLLLVGVFLTLAGLRIIKLRWFVVVSGSMTWAVGILLMVVGVGLSLPIFYFSPPALPLTPIPIFTPVVSAPAVIPVRSTETSLPASGSATQTSVLMTSTPIYTTSSSTPISAGSSDTGNEFSEKQFSLFMQFYYPELKDLILQFLTLCSSILAFSVVFAEKVAVLKTPIGRKHIPIISSWVLFLLGLILGGYGLWELYTAGEIANGSLIYQYNIGFIDLVRSVYNVLNVAGVCFVGGLMMLALSALLKINEKDEATSSN